MKNLNFSVLLILIFGLSACQKDEREKAEVLSVSQKSSLMYSLGYFAENDRALVQKQADHSRLSEFQRDDKSGELYYIYEPQVGYLGRDYVELRTLKSNGTKNEETVKTLLIKVVE